MNLVILLGLGIIAYKMYNQAGELSTALSYRFSGLTYLKKQSTLQLTGLQTNMILTNPTAISANLNGVSGTAYISAGANKYPLGTYQVPNNFIIPKNGSVTVPLIIGLSNSDAIKAILAIIATKQVPVIDLIGTIKTTAGNVPFSYQLKP